MKRYLLPFIFLGGISAAILGGLYLNDYLPTFEQWWHVIKVTLISLLILYIAIPVLIHDKGTGLSFAVGAVALAWFLNLFGCT